ncbi:hypothetical protein DSO57_1002304 [Entomophthora muscae]|uniref:Uncharacterized protein n=1 Tax=Entomophthora muscae TaxID=34485 RepID=A0ACC2TJI3_9FUNG|nr:hypothetical protein DSO57_1002304 [Entomophthora muscae]
MIFSLLLTSLVSSATVPNCIASAGDRFIPILVQLEAPTEAINEIHHMELPSDRKAQELVARLQKYSTASQKELVDHLNELKQQGSVKDYRSYYISNTIAVDAAKESISDIANFNGVKEIGCNYVPKSRKRRSTPNIQSSHLSFEYPEYGTNENPDLKLHPSFYGPGIHQVKVPEIEDNIFKKAASLVIGIIDSGFDFAHQALVENYKGSKGNHFDHNYTFFDGTRTLDEITPRNDDEVGHGTGVISVAVGKKPLGISPQSKWIGCKAFVGASAPTENYLRCQQFLLAPTNLKGESPNALLRPHVIENAWGCGEEENCLNTPFKYTSHALHVAGIFNVAGGGNFGKTTCETLSFPPPENIHSFVVAGLQWNSTLSAIWSSVGPSKFRKNAIDIAAPGQYVLTAKPNTEYTYSSGNSFSSPLVAGGALLVMAACPHLQRDPEGLAKVLRNSATPLYSNLTCGGDTAKTVPNNEFGYGLVNIKEAITECKPKGA